MTGGIYKMPESKYGKYIVSELKVPDTIDPEMIARMEKWNHLISWIDDTIVPGSFQMNCCWFVKVPEEQPYFAHTHDTPEIIGLFGGDPGKPNDMGGEVEFWMEDEKFIINKSCMIFVPAGIRHCPLIIRRVDRPIFHFTVVTSGIYKMNS
jgi:hypothetical protein